MRFSIISVAAAVCLIAGIQAAPTPQTQNAQGSPTDLITGTLNGGTSVTGGNDGTATGSVGTGGTGSANIVGAITGALGSQSGSIISGLPTGAPGRRKRSEQSVATPEGNPTDASTETGTTTQSETAGQAGQGTGAAEQTKDGNIVENLVGSVKKVASNPDKTASTANVVRPATEAIQNTAGKVTGSRTQNGLGGNVVSKFTNSGGSLNTQ